MSLWDVNAPEYPPELIGNVFPTDEMLFEYNGPLIFTFKTHWNGIALAYLSDEEENILRYVIAPTCESIVKRLKSGIISILDALDQPMTWLADITTDGVIRRSWLIHIKDLPEDAIPKPDVLLYPHLEPLLTIKANGRQIKDGDMPAQVIKQVVSGVESAIKGLFDYARSHHGRSGRPPDALRFLYKLNTQQFTFGSLKMSFREPEWPVQQEFDFPEHEALKEAFSKVKEIFDKGILWAADNKNDAAPDFGENTSPKDMKHILKAVKELTPYGDIETVELSGTILESIHQKHESVHLTHESRRKVSRILRTITDTDDEYSVFDKVGVIRELDRDNHTFSLREITDMPEQQCSFSAEHIDPILEAFNEETRVHIVGQFSKEQQIVEVKIILPNTVI